MSGLTCFVPMAEGSGSERYIPHSRMGDGIIMGVRQIYAGNWVPGEGKRSFDAIRMTHNASALGKPDCPGKNPGHNNCHIDRLFSCPLCQGAKNLDRFLIEDIEIRICAGFGDHYCCIDCRFPAP
jgi:hypothetical protein